MGRPKKRRREGEADNVVAPLAHVDESAITPNEFSSFAILGMITPPQFHDQYLIANSIGSELGTLHPQQLDSEITGLSPISTIECVHPKASRTVLTFS
jgi:hypothetical protein